MDDADLIAACCREITKYCSDRKSVLIFASGVDHGRHVAEYLRKHYHEEVGEVWGETLPFMRDETLRNFKAGKIKYLVNYAVLTHGFDAPNIDCVVLLRPTASPGLYVQMCGRGFRIHESKTDCLVLDYGGNILRHGPVDAIEIEARNTRAGGEAPAKICPECQAAIATGYTVCPQCGYQFPDPETSRHDAEASNAAPLSGEVTVIEHAVISVHVYLHVKRNSEPGDPRTMRVDYDIGFLSPVSEWVCFEHSGYARAKAESWWKARCNLPCPNSIEEAIAIVRDKWLAKTKSITVREVSGERFPRIIAHELGDKPIVEPGSMDGIGEDADWYEDMKLDDIPF